MDKYQFFDNLVQQVRDIDIDSVMGSYIQLKNKGRHRHALCPFHNDKKLGSFVVTPFKGMWYCFTCGVGGDSIKFVSDYKKISYVEATFEIALKYNIIGQDEYEEYYSKRRYSKEKTESIKKKYDDENKKRIREMEGEKADADTLDKVYRIFIKHTNLTKKHEKHLKQVRKLNKKEIKDQMFFTMPDRRILRGFISDIEKEFEDIEVLSTIPGFFYDKEKEKFSFMKMYGLGIPSFDLNGRITGIQVRKNTKSKNGRYIWFSSTFAIGHEKYSKGTSVGSPIDVIIPDVIKSRTVMITEGKFKGLSLAKNTNSIVIDVAGVTTWRGIIDIIENLEYNKKAQQNYVKTGKYQALIAMIAYDADLSMNVAVFNQAKKMAEKLKEMGLFVNYLYWDSNVAKGIDDLYNIDKEHLISRYNVDTFNMSYKKMLKQIMKNEPYDKVYNIPKEVVQSYFEDYMVLAPLQKGEF